MGYEYSLPNMNRPRSIHKHDPHPSKQWGMCDNCDWNPQVTGEFPSQMASNADTIFIWWRHDGRRRLEPGQLRFFHGNSNSFEISFCSYPTCRGMVAIKFRTWHDSYTVVACTKPWSDMITYSGVHRIWIAMEKALVKWIPDHQLPWYFSRSLGLFQLQCQKG